ncbi:hypothetical protein [Nocardia sp. NBC_00511]|uniref:hypothetical protein n=1 Tax=Nocardia sp. NBC_00511 TaxID=2903591 RepID=UPI0030E4BD79
MLFDIRGLIAGLLACYGIILIICSVTYDPAKEAAKTDGIHLNLWSGLGMLAVAAVLFAWMWLRPVTQPEDPSADEPDRDGTST